MVEEMDHSQTDLLASIIDYEIAAELARFYDRLLEPEEDDILAEPELTMAATAS